MAHFARINARGFVSQVIVAEQDFIDSLPDADSWVQTSYNTFGGVHYDPETRQPDDGVALRKNYAGIGFKYDIDRDAFIPPQPYASWFLVEESCLWQSPEPMPEVPVDEAGQPTGYYMWSEDEYNAGNGGWVFLAFEGE
jgi:hypothetical protein